MGQGALAAKSSDLPLLRDVILDAQQQADLALLHAARDVMWMRRGRTPDDHAKNPPKSDVLSDDYLYGLCAPPCKDKISKKAAAYSMALWYFYTGSGFEPMYRLAEEEEQKRIIVWTAAVQISMLFQIKLLEQAAAMIKLHAHAVGVAAVAMQADNALTDTSVPVRSLPPVAEESLRLRLEVAKSQLLQLFLSEVPSSLLHPVYGYLCKDAGMSLYFSLKLCCEAPTPNSNLDTVNVIRKKWSKDKLMKLAMRRVPQRSQYSCVTSSPPRTVAKERLPDWMSAANHGTSLPETSPHELFGFCLLEWRCRFWEQLESDVISYVLPSPKTLANCLLSSVGYENFLSHNPSVFLCDSAAARRISQQNPTIRRAPRMLTCYKLLEHYRALDRIILVQRLRRSCGPLGRLNFDCVREVMFFLHPTPGPSNFLRRFVVPAEMVPTWKREGFPQPPQQLSNLCK